MPKRININLDEGNGFDASAIQTSLSSLLARADLELQILTEPYTVGESFRHTDGQNYRVKIDAAIGETPTTDPNKFELIGGETFLLNYDELKTYEVGNMVTVLGIPFVNKVAIAIPETFVPAKWTCLDRNLKTGVLSGGDITISGTPTLGTTFDVSATTGIIVDNSDTLNYLVTPIIFPATANIPNENLATGTSQILIDVTGTLFQLAIRTVDDELQNLSLGRTSNSGGLATNRVIETKTSYSTAKTTQAFLGSIGGQSIVSTIFEPGATGLTVNTIGISKILSQGRNFIVDSDNPDLADVLPETPVIDAHFFQTFITDNNATFNINTPLINVVDPNQYNPLGDTLTVTPTGKFQVQRIYTFGGTSIHVFYYGRTLYDSLAEALQSFETSDEFTEHQVTSPGAFSAFLIVKEGITDWSDPTTFQFINRTGGIVGSFDRGIPSGGVGGLTEAQLQAALAKESTGAISGGIVTPGTNPLTQVSQAEGQHQVADHSAIPFTRTIISFAEDLDIDLTTAPGADLTKAVIYVFKLEDGSRELVSTDTQSPTSQEFRDKVFHTIIRTTFGLVANEIRSISNRPLTLNAPLNQLQDGAIGTKFTTKEGNSIVAANSAVDFSVNKLSGFSKGIGINVDVTFDNPNTKSIPLINNIQYRYITALGEVTGTLLNDPDVIQFHDGAAFQTVAANGYSIKKLWFDPINNLFWLQYGTANYSAADVDNGLHLQEESQEPPLISETSYVLARFVLRGNATNFDSDARNAILLGDGVGGGGAGGGSGIAVVDNLLSTDPNAALSANQGKVLKDKQDLLVLYPPSILNSKMLFNRADNGTLVSLDINRYNPATKGILSSVLNQDAIDEMLDNEYCVNDITEGLTFTPHVDGDALLAQTSDTVIKVEFITGNDTGGGQHTIFSMGNPVANRLFLNYGANNAIVVAIGDVSNALAIEELVGIEPNTKYTVVLSINNTTDTIRLAFDKTRVIADADFITIANGTGVINAVTWADAGNLVFGAQPLITDFSIASGVVNTTQVPCHPKGSTMRKLGDGDVEYIDRDGNAQHLIGALTAQLTISNLVYDDNDAGEDILRVYGANLDGVTWVVDDGAITTIIVSPGNTLVTLGFVPSTGPAQTEVTLTGTKDLEVVDAFVLLVPSPAGFFVTDSFFDDLGGFITVFGGNFTAGTTVSVSAGVAGVVTVTGGNRSLTFPYTPVAGDLNVIVTVTESAVSIETICPLLEAGELEVTQIMMYRIGLDKYSVWIYGSGFDLSTLVQEPSHLAGSLAVTGAFDIVVPFPDGRTILTNYTADPGQTHLEFNVIRANRIIRAGIHLENVPDVWVIDSIVHDPVADEIRIYGSRLETTVPTIDGATGTLIGFTQDVSGKILTLNYEEGIAETIATFTLTNAQGIELDITVPMITAPVGFAVTDAFYDAETVNTPITIYGNGFVGGVTTVVPSTGTITSAITVLSTGKLIFDFTKLVGSSTVELTVGDGGTNEIIVNAELIHEDNEPELTAARFANGRITIYGRKFTDGTIAFIGVPLTVDTVSTGSQTRQKVFFYTPPDTLPKVIDVVSNGKTWSVPVDIATPASSSSISDVANTRNFNASGSFVGVTFTDDPTFLAGLTGNDFVIEGQGQRRKFNRLTDFPSAVGAINFQASVATFNDKVYIFMKDTATAPDTWRLFEISSLSDLDNAIMIEIDTTTNGVLVLDDSIIFMTLDGAGNFYFNYGGGSSTTSNSIRKATLSGGVLTTVSTTVLVGGSVTVMISFMVDDLGNIIGTNTTEHYTAWNSAGVVLHDSTTIFPAGHNYLVNFHFGGVPHMYASSTTINIVAIVRTIAIS